MPPWPVPSIAWGVSVGGGEADARVCRPWLGWKAHISRQLPGRDGASTGGGLGTRPRRERVEWCLLISMSHQPPTSRDARAARGPDCSVRPRRFLCKHIRAVDTWCQAEEGCPLHRMGQALMLPRDRTLTDRGT